AGRLAQRADPGGVRYHAGLPGALPSRRRYVAGRGALPLGRAAGRAGDHGRQSRAVLAGSDGPPSARPSGVLPRRRPAVRRDRLRAPAYAPAQPVPRLQAPARAALGEHAAGSQGPLARRTARPAVRPGAEVPLSAEELLGPLPAGP